MPVLGESSISSIVQSQDMMWKMHKTPSTPIKSIDMVTPKKSDRKRSLFQTGSPTESDDLGLMMVLSPSSCSSINTIDSPQFSPNGKFSTPSKTPNFEKLSPKQCFKRIEVKSSLFPDLKLPTPKLKDTPKTQKSLISKISCSSLESFDQIDKGIEKLKTPQSKNNEHTVMESDTSPSLCNLTEQDLELVNNEENLKLKIKPLSSESFYGFKEKIPKAKTALFIDSLAPINRGRQVDRLSDCDYLSNRSFVSGGTRRKTSSKNRRSKLFNADRRRPPHAGVWHNIKKPKQIKKITKSEKPLISPESRLTIMMSSKKEKKIKIKSKPLFQENPRKRFARSKKRNRNDGDDNSIIDSFPDHLIKRQKLPTTISNVHPAFDEARCKETTVPDPNKKFLKYGQTKTATFTLNDNVKFRISDGIIKLQTPKKRRKLYSGRKDSVEDFNDFEEGDNEMEENIQGILKRLHNEKEISPVLKANIKLKKLELFDIAEKDKVTNTVNITSSKIASAIHRSPLKTVSNLPTLICNDFDSDDNEENVPSLKDASVFDKGSNETSLGKTGNIVSYLTHILVNKDDDDSEQQFKKIETENSPPKDGKLFSLFYKHNWSKSLNLNESSSTKNFCNKKKILVPDDQYLLDAGQKSIGVITCKKCGVMYQAGDFADEATHNNFHNHLPELKFLGWNNERVVGKFPDGRVIMVLNTDPKIWWQKVSKIVDIVDQELGFPEASVPSLFYKTVYLYVNEKTKQIAGCLIAEECKVAFKMFPPLEGVEIDSCSKEPSPCKVGISRIWTALSQRRKGIASRMVDCLQRTFFFGEIISKDQIAFSVPSPPGKAFAQKVTGRLDFLVYGFP